ncbi:DUF397 domain-containing protein [Streptomyces sp. NPDC001678]|uniref:DUF397 domain-containing protein n=1 Tax=Streptomyces sp. NPDC001678 TaxID=3364599 RepID=UPI00367CD977
MSEFKWQKSSFSTEGNECVELSRSGETVLVRESDTPSLVLTTAPGKLRGLLIGVKAGGLTPRKK